MGKYVSADTIWVLIGAFLVFAMQPGFAMVETGFTRAKNAANIVMKNVMDKMIKRKTLIMLFQKKIRQF